MDKFAPFSLIILCIAVGGLSSPLLKFGIWGLTLVLITILRYDSRLFVGAAIFLLLSSLIFIAGNGSAIADQISIISYYFLIVGILSFLLEYFREDHKTSNKSNPKEKQVNDGNRLTHLNITKIFEDGKVKLKRLLKEDVGLIYTTIGGMGASFLGAFFWFILASLLTVDNYGLANYYISIAVIFSGVGTMGLNMTVTTYLAKGENKLLYEANMLTLVAGLVSALVLSVFQWASGLLAVSLIFFSMTTAELLGRKNYKEFAFVSIGQRVTQMVLGLLLYFQIGVIGIIIGYFLGSLIFSYKYLASIKNFSFSIINLKEKRNFTIHSYGYTLIGQTLSNYLDKVLIGAVFGYFALGLYQLGFQFFMFLSLIPMSLQQYLLPEESSGNNRREIKIIGVILSTVASIALFFLCPYIITNFFPTFTDAIPLVSLMSLSVIPSAVAVILTASFLGNGKSKQVFTAGVIYLTSLMVCLAVMGLTIGILGLALAVITAKTIQATYMVTQRNKPSPEQLT